MACVAFIPGLTSDARSGQIQTLQVSIQISLICVHREVILHAPKYTP